jgi:hypothetical protein
MDYASSIEWAEAELIFWSKAKVLEVIQEHGHDIHDDATMDGFSHACQPSHITDSGTRYFSAADVLGWLGY